MRLFGKRDLFPAGIELELAERLRRHVHVLAELIGPRHVGQPSTMDAAAAYIQRQFEDIGDVVTRQTYRVADYDAANVVVERIGTTRPHEIVVVGAHYDTVACTPGADDNASAVAMLIEAARLLAPFQSNRTLRFVGFPCEEPPHFHMGLMGSQEYARGCRKRNEKIVGMICLEMVGYYTTKPDSQRTPEGIPRLLQWAFPKRGDFLASVGNMHSLKILVGFRRGFKQSSSFGLYSIALPETITAIRRSDNSSFWDQGYPALMITDTSFLRNPHYHLPSDTPDTLDYARMSQATIGVAGGVARLTD